MSGLTFLYFINAEPSKVWDALVKPEGTKAVFFDCVFQSELKTGSSFAYIGPGKEGAETLHIYGEIMACDPGRRLVLKEHPGPSYYDNHGDISSRISYTLEPIGSGTKLTLVNDEFVNNQHGMERYEQEWPMMMCNLKSWVETGKTIHYGW